MGWTSNGTQWHWTLFDDVNGGSEAFLTAFGPRGMIYSSPSDVLAATSNGSTWSDLRSEVVTPTRITAGHVVISTTTTTTTTTKS